MTQLNKITSIIYQAVEQVNELLSQEYRLEKRAQTPISEQSGGTLDSMGMVNLIIAIEQLLEEELGISLALADDLDISEENNPFETIGVLAKNIDALLDQDKVPK